MGIIDRDKVISSIEKEIHLGEYWDESDQMVDLQLLRDAIALLKEQEAIVRCKDCKHHGKDTCSAAAGIVYPPPDDWFCADGKRKEGR